jgi:hypothetical protein
MAGEEKEVVQLCKCGAVMRQVVVFVDDGFPSIGCTMTKAWDCPNSHIWNFWKHLPRYNS